MSQASFGDTKFWQCFNTDCSAGQDNEIPSTVGLKFPICPFCGTRQPKPDAKSITDQLQKDGQTLSEPAKEIEGASKVDASLSVSQGQSTSTRPIESSTEQLDGVDKGNLSQIAPSEEISLTRDPSDLENNFTKDLTDQDETSLVKMKVSSSNDIQQCSNLKADINIGTVHKRESLEVQDKESEEVTLPKMPIPQQELQYSTNSKKQVDDSSLSGEPQIQSSRNTEYNVHDHESLPVKQTEYNSGASTSQRSSMQLSIKKSQQKKTKKVNRFWKSFRGKKKKKIPKLTPKMSKKRANTEPDVFGFNLVQLPQAKIGSQSPKILESKQTTESDHSQSPEILEPTLSQPPNQTSEFDHSLQPKTMEPSLSQPSNQTSEFDNSQLPKTMESPLSQPPKQTSESDRSQSPEILEPTLSQSPEQTSEFACSQSPKLIEPTLSQPFKQASDEFFHVSKGSESHYPVIPVDKRWCASLEECIEKNFIKIIFHVIIPTQLWEWDDKSQVFLRFGCKDHEWKYNLGHFEKLRMINQMYGETSCNIWVDPEELICSIPYKYVIISPKSLSRRVTYYEFLGEQFASHSKKYQAINRALNLSASEQVQAVNEGVYHQYDTMAVPEDVSMSRWWYEMKSGVRSLLGMQHKPNLQPFSLNMEQICLQVYLELEELKKDLVGVTFDKKLTMEKYVEQVHHLFVCLSEPSTTLYSYPVAYHYVDVKNENTSHLKKYFVEWLEQVVSSPPHKKRLQFVVCTMWCISKLNISFDSPEVRRMAPALLNLLSLRYSKDEHKEWVEYNQLCAFLPSKEHRDMISEAITTLVQTGLSVAVFNHELRMTPWIFGIPLYSFLTGTYKPYDDICVQSVTKLTHTWSLLGELFNLTNIRNYTERMRSDVKVYFTRYERLFDCDLLTLQAFVYVCPVPDLLNLFNHLPPNVSAVWLSFILTKLGYEVRTEEDARNWSFWMCLIESKISDDTYQRSPDISSTLLTSVMFLLEQLTLFVRSSSEHCVSVIKNAASLVCTTLQVLSDKTEKFVFESFEEVSGLIKNWIEDPRVIGKKMLGYRDPVSTANSDQFSREEEIRIWNTFLSLKCKEWHRIIHALFLERLKEVPEVLIIQLLQFVEQNGPQCLTTLVVNDDTLTVKAANRFLSIDDSSDELLASVDKITSELDSRVFGIVLSYVMEKRYPTELKAMNYDWITLDVLLKWVAWPNYLKIVRQSSECCLKKGLSPDCQEVCHQALLNLKAICTQIQSGEIIVRDLHNLSTNTEQFKRLCEAAGDETLTPSVILECLDQRSKEFRLFMQRRSAYQDICNRILDPSRVEGLTDLKENLACDISDQKVCSLYEFKDGTLRMLCYTSAEPFSHFVDHFVIMMKKSSSLFLKFMDKKIETLQHKTDLTIQDIYTEIWMPVFEECQALVESLISQRITLSQVDKDLRIYSETNLEMVVQTLVDGVKECLKLSLDQEQLNNSLTKIRTYWKLSGYQTGAQVLLELKEILGLEGDFELVEKFSKELSESMKNKTLEDIDDNVTDTGNFLEGITNNSLRQKCLEAFKNSQDIVTWLKNFSERKSIKDIQGFVTVALDTAAGGEGALAHDKLSHLHTVGYGFASLIYEVNKTDGYKQLVVKCKSLWESLAKNENLPELLESCNSDLEWYKSVKETHGSVETTTYGQMTNILKYGVYAVSLREDAQTTVHTVHSLITVTLTQRYQKLAKTKYTLDELRDLESKLVLICGNETDRRVEVEHYLNLLHNATRIAELYLDLQKAGEITYSTEYLQFRCALYDEEELEAKIIHPLFDKDKAKEIMSDLQEYIRRLNKRLVDWNRSVDAARGKYYELNYFTTLQLLELQKDLGHLSQPTAAAPIVEPRVLMLLRSISPEISSTVLSDSLQAVHYGHESTLLQMPAKTIPEVENVSKEGRAPIRKKTLPSVRQKPNPSLTIPTFEDLSEKQQVIFTNCVEWDDFPKSLVLRALQACAQNASEQEIARWCLKNEGEKSIGDDTSCSESNVESNEDENDNVSLSDTEQDNVDEAFAETVPDTQELVTTQTGVSSTETNHLLKIVYRPFIDKTNPNVQQLVNAGCEPQDAVKAFDQFRDLQKAMNHLIALEKKEFEGGAQANEESVEKNTDIEIEEVIVYERRDPDVSKNHLKLDQLGLVLQAISKKVSGAVKEERTFSSYLFEAGQPNLLVTTQDNILRSVLALYSTDTELPLPTQEEVFLCTEKTNTEEVSLFWRRAIGDPNFKRIFCLAHAEKLSYQVCDSALKSLNELSQGKNDYRLVVICTEEGRHITSRLHLYKRPAVPPLSDIHCRAYLKDHFTQSTDTESTSSVAGTCASTVDPDKLCVRVVSSTRSGMGKSLFIKRRAEELIKTTLNQDIHVTIPIHGPIVDSDILLDFFKEHTTRNACTLYHLDIAPRVLQKVDYLLFSLLILNGLSDSRGNVWKCQPSQLYMVEVTIPETEVGDDGFQTLKLLSLLPTSQCVSPGRVVEQDKLGDGTLGMDEKEFSSPTVQRVYQYLRRHSDKSFDLDNYVYEDSVVEGKIQDFLRVILSQCGVRDPSWTELHYFMKFLDIQLHTCENSIYCDKNILGNSMSGLKRFVIKFMIRMSRDFSTPSLVGVLNFEEEKRIGEGGQLGQYQIIKRRKWEQSSHPYIFFNDDKETITFVGFRVNELGDLIDPNDNSIIEQAIMKSKLYEGLKRNKVDFNANCHDWSKEEMIKKLALVMGFEYSHDPDDSYVLTTDNLIKMLAIQMRFRCDIPVVIMGETGCGKTRLVRYMCDLARQKRDLKNMLILKIHGGIRDKDVIQFVEDAEDKARTNKKTDSKLDTVVFFDEANTTESIGLIKEIMCDRRMNGRAISSDLKFIAACNPYRMHTEEMIHKLETAGLGFYVRETQQKLGKIPLRQLVYRVLDIPPSMRPLVYDFGQLNTNTEYDYTSQIVKDHISRHQELSAVCEENIYFIKTISVVLAASQKFMRDQKNECSFVSLRDVERAMILFKYFYDKMSTVFAPLINEKAKKDLREDVLLPCSDITRALLLSLSVCYHARLQQREPYEEQISANFQTPLDLPGDAQQFRNEIKWCQGGLLDNMVIGDNIAKNAALRENVFMMTICIELRIPLFLVGKPGSSKSLAKSIIQDSLHGQRSRSPLLREFKPVHMFSYQCSQLSTPEGIIDVFKSADKFQSSQDIKQYVSVVVLDEVGLAEDSPSLPLKALHPLLEDGTEGSGKDHQYQAVEREKRVAFIGISNWALDPAKMNRGVMVTRGEPGLQELQLSARGICSTKDNDPVREQLQRYFEPLSRAYMTICKKQKRQFFGLRDFYSLIKMLYWMCNNSKSHPLTQTQLEHAIKRNFGGLEDEDLDPFEEFQNAIGHLESKQESTGDQQLDSILNPDCTKLGLIKTSLSTKETTWHGENRYLLFLTENYAALDILKHFLKIGSKDSKDEDNQPYILFGSSFPKDNDYTQVCRNINEIKICMEIGKTVILLNLENLYESLYDVLNQYYLPYCGKRYVDLGLQTLRVKCRVDSNFKLILIGEKDTVYRKFSTPLINRLEKHFVLASSVLEKWQHKLLRWFEEWIKDFSHTKEMQGNQFEEAHAFIGYQKDTPAAVIFQATIQLKRLVERQGEQKKETCCQLKKAGILNDDFLHDLLEKREDSSCWSEAVRGLSQFLLLQTASDDAIVRLQNARLTEADVELCWSLYYEHQHHHSLKEFLVNECKKDHETLMQVSTHSPLMTQKELKGIAESLSMKFVLLDLHGFDTEVDFTNKIRPVFFQEESNHEANPFLLIIQCDSGHLNYNLIACARYRVCYEASKAKAKDEISRLKNVTHILFIIRLPQQEVKSQFVGFQGDPWISAHIDDLRASSEATVLPEQAFTAKISELFIGKYDDLKKPLKEPEEVIALEFDQPVEEVIKYKPETRETKEDREILEESEKVVLGEVGDVSMSEELEDTTDQSNEPEDSDEKRVLSGPLQGAQIESSKLCRESLELEKEVSDLEKSEETETGPADYVEKADKQISTWSEKPTSDISQNHEHSHSSDTNSSVNSDGENSTEQGKVRAKRIGKSKPLHAHHQRLLGCVQAAVSMLSGSKQDRSLRRIQHLIFLIQKSIPDQLDEKSFYSLLVTFIHEALKQSEEVETSTGGKDWVLMEALNGRKLQNGGTFRNVLARRIDEVITPYFAQVIAHIDQNCNLDLLDPNNQATPISKFWLDMFKLSGGMIDFFSVAAGKIMIKTEFPCQLPFSWLIKDTVDALNTSIQSIVQHSYHQFNSIQTKCVEDLRQSDVGNILFQVSEDDVDCFYHLYLNDFVRYCYKSVYEDKFDGKEYELIMNALDALTKNPCLCSVKSLPHKIVALHLVYNQCYSEVYQFGQLVQHRPGILYFRNLLNDHADGNDWEFTLHLHAVQRVLESNVDADSSTRQVIGLSPSLYNLKQAEVTSNIHHWLYCVRLSQNVIDTILKSSVSTEAVIKARIVWQKIRALQIFAETVYVPLSDLEGIHFIIRRLDGLISNHSDFLKKENLDLVQAVLSNIFEAKKLKIDKADVVTWKKVSKCCKHFFVELVSSLCFGGREAPEPALVMSLIDMVLGGTCTEPSKFTTHIALNDSPVVRSFLLQLLLERNHFSEDVDEYFCKVLVNDSGQAEQELCLLCIHCFEDTCSKKILALPRGQRSPRVKTILQSSFKFLQEHLKPEATLKYLQAVGRVRFGLSFVVEQLIQDQIDDDLLQVVQSLCADPSINERATAGPAIYLIKLIIRHFGFSYLEDIGAANSWIIPTKIAKEYKEEEIDMFLIYGNDYMTMRNAVNTALLTKNTEELQACIEGGCKPSFFTLALYQKATLSRASNTSAKPTQTEGLHGLDTYIKEWTGLSPDLKQMMRLLLGNQQGVMLAQMTVSPNQPALCRTLGGIVVHAVAVIMSNSDVDLFLPFVNILANPSALENAYLPTMPEDMCMLPEVRKTGGAFYQCPNQHPYFVGECKQTVEEEVCRECGTRIHHQKKINNGRVEMIDATRTGHDLGDSKQRPINVERERDLSATAVCIIRAIMHSLFVWAACNNQQELMNIAEVTKGKVSPKNLPEFFWMHLEKDIECLRRCTGRGVDECAIIVHQVLQRILFSSSHTSAIVTDVKCLKSKNARRDWEQLFNDYYIKPVITNLDASITKAVNVMTSGDQQENNHLLYLAFEKMKLNEPGLETHLWTYRPLINLDHLKRIVQIAGSSSILDAFLEVEPSLRATQYLPDIVKLQRFLFNFYNKRLRKGEAKGLTINDFFEKVQEKLNVNTKNECRAMFLSLRQAWKLVRHKLKNYNKNRLVVEEQYLLPEFTPDTQLVYLIPTTMREGRCTTVLVDHLVLTHNDFIEKCRKHSAAAAEGKGAEFASFVWRNHKVPITHIHHCHMMEYELQLQSIIVSHCHCSLSAEEGQQIEFDLEALEKQILNQFVYGKPIIQMDIPNVAYCKDIHTVETFLEIRCKVKPQEVLDQRIQQDIVTELRTPDKLRECLDVVEIVMGLLSSEGGNPKLKLKKYIDSCRMKNKSFSAKAKEHCTLGHIISLWETICVELARQLWETKLEPFEAIPGECMTDLTGGQKVELDKCLRMFDLGLLLGALFEYIEIHVKQTTTMDKSHHKVPLVKALGDYWAITEQSPIDLERLKKDFPSTITVEQAAAAWKYIADYKVKPR